MSTQASKAALFKELHVPGQPLVLFNIWDPGSAQAVQNAGALALATGSAPVAMAQGFRDGQQLPLSSALKNVSRIVEQTDLPVTLDFEGGYAEEPANLKENTTRALGVGVVGLNFEDQVVGSAELYSVSVQQARVEAVRQAIDASNTGAFLNARTDMFLKAERRQHDEKLLEQAIQRAHAFADAGADGFFAPNLVDEALIGQLCERVPLPVNVIALPGCPPKSRLAELGVARLSYGPVPYKQVMSALSAAAREAL